MISQGKGRRSCAVAAVPRQYEMRVDGEVGCLSCADESVENARDAYRGGFAAGSPYSGVRWTPDGIGQR